MLHLRGLALSAILALGCSHPTEGGAPVAPPSAGLAPADPVALLKKQAEADHLYDLRCVSFMPDGQEQGMTLVVVREKHGEGCPGDPAVAPTRDHYRVDAKGTIEWMDIPKGSYVPYASRPRR